LKRLLPLTLLLISCSSLAHEVRLISHFIKINRQNQTAWQTDVLAKATLNRKFELGAQASYLERFNEQDRAAGPYLAWRVAPWLGLEAGYLQGSGNEIMAQNLLYINAYYALEPGYSPFLLYRSARYSVTQLQAATLGIEIERLKNLIFIPQVMLGKATFQSPGKTDDVYNYGMRVIYYVEGSFGVFTYAHMGKEASQGIIGRSSILVDTLTGGLGGSYVLRPDLKAELAIDHTDFAQLNNQFITTTLNLSWSF
jgi:hypothetical protein